MDRLREIRGVIADYVLGTVIVMTHVSLAGWIDGRASEPRQLDTSMSRRRGSAAIDE